ncbi:MAG: beta galactosidase jelly roll domain-containing protein [Kiritimatiellia bacterium]|nr:beta galactosidase jelly roll domain-containing protein [Kiritimatiellia bacterium]
MKKMFRFFLLALFPLVFHARAAGSENLVQNGDFEAGAEWAAPWSRARGATLAVEEGNRFLRIDGGNVSASQRIPLDPGWWKLRLTLRMRVKEVVVGDEGWKNARLAMSFHAEDGTRVGDWPNVFHAEGTFDWKTLERDYLIPKGAAYLVLNPAHFGPSGRVDFDDLRLTVTASRDEEFANAPLPDGFPGEPWDPADAALERTATQSRLCINGLWQFRPFLETDDAGRVPEAVDRWGWFKVPGIWPTTHWTLSQNSVQTMHMASGLDPREWDSQKMDQAWYRRRIRIPADWGERRIRLVFTMLQTHAAVFVDGRPAGEVWFPGGSLDLTEAVRPGSDHELTLRVTARPLEADRADFMAPDRIILSKAAVKLKGITGDVFLESAPPQDAIRDVRVVASAHEGRIGFDLGLVNTSKSAYRVRAVIAQGTQTVRTLEWEKGERNGSRLSVSADWPDAPRWDVDTPENLLLATVSVLDADGSLLDEALPVRFGFRDIRISGKDFLLNDVPIRLRALHNVTANTLADEACAEGARRSIARMQEYGFNFIIFGNYNFVPGEVGYMDALLDACDETGMLVSVSLPHAKDFDWKLHDPDVAARFRELTEWIIRRVQNHPSVIFYGMTHNATGYRGDQNPLKIDGLYDPDLVARPLDADGNPQRSQTRAQAMLAQGIARSIDPDRPVYHHQSGNLGDMHTVNIYLNWAPPQERSDWLAHWSTVGQKPLFFVEWGLPHVSSWSSYRGPLFIWRYPALQSLWVSEFSAAHVGERAYAENPGLRAALDAEEKFWEKGEPFLWSHLVRELRERDALHGDVMALFTAENWRMHRAWGISAMLPWDQGQFWNRVKPTEVTRNPNPFDHLQRPGIVPDLLAAGQQYIRDPGPEDHFEPSSIGRAFLRWNQPLCAFIGGDPSGHGAAGPTIESERRFTEKSHLVLPGASVTKSLVILNDTRRERSYRYTWRLGEGSGALTGEGEGRIEPAGRQFLPLGFRIPESARPGTLPLHVRLEFGPEDTQEDEFVFTVLAAEPPTAPRKPVKLLDPTGTTAAFLKRIGVAFEPCALDGKDVKPGDVVVIGERALSSSERAGRDWPIFRLASEGTRFLILAQDADALTAMGFRINIHSLRQLYLRDLTHPALKGFSDAHFSNWTGSSTLIEPFLNTLPVEATDPTWSWCGFQNTRVWRAGNLGSVASVLIEKPSRGNWIPLLDGGFDLQYAPLLETTAGAGRLIFSQLEIAHRTLPETVGDRLVLQLLRYLETAPKPAARTVFYRGDPRGAELLRDLGLTPQPCPDEVKKPNRALIVAGPGSRPPQNLQSAIKAGAHVLAIGLDAEALAAWFPGSLAGETKPVLSVPAAGLASDPMLRGLSQAELHWRRRPLLAALKGEGHPALRVLRQGRGAVVICQVAPWHFDAEAHPPLRTTWRRTVFLISRLLGNLDAGSSSPVLEGLSRAPLAVEQGLTEGWRGLEDPKKAGRDAGWWKSGFDDGAWPAIQVPGTFQSHRPDLDGYNGYFWYRLSFDIPAGFEGDGTTLFLGAIDDESWVWLNGEFLGEVTRATNPEDHWNFPRSYVLPRDLLRAGRHQLTVLVNDTYRTGGLMGNPRLTRPGPWLNSYYLQTPVADDDPYRYYRW